ncbi:MAG: methyltransferase domain-containing protein [Acidobacteria bacterium]|jgi:O-antigen chain-terminating methyltransferase|nr:methyltransferase domain-containing protein [Acidobacteriota bacterium]
MRRVIEDLVEKRKARQEELNPILDDLAAACAGSGWLKKNGGKARESLARLQAALTDFITAQDKEWNAYSNHHATTVFKSLQWKIEKLEAEYSNLKTLLVHFAQLENKLDRLLESFDRRPTPEIAGELRQVKEQLSPLQYADFERRFRGGSEEIAAHLSAYLPLFPAGGEVLDIGCGRGEFLALLQESGRRPLGLDLSDSMLEEARARGLEAFKADALEFLKARPDDSLDGVFSSQVIEHFEPEYLRRVVAECFRVMRPGAVLLLETINPLSLFALSRIYFLDPTHQRPLHPEYMRYLLENTGFSAVEILYGAEPTEEKLVEADPALPQALPYNENIDRLNRLLFPPSEYAAKGLKPPGPKGPGRRDPQGPSSRSDETGKP